MAESVKPGSTYDRCRCGHLPSVHFPRIGCTVRGGPVGERWSCSCTGYVADEARREAELTGFAMTTLHEAKQWAMLDAGSCWQRVPEDWEDE